MNFNFGILRYRKILIIDDNQLNRKILFEHLNKVGSIVLTASDGEEAIEVAIKERPDLILLDVMMPKINGFEVCRKLKEDDRTQNIPIIFQTARIAHEDIIKGLKLGAVDYINKPFLHPEELLARITTQVELKDFRDNLITTNENLIRINQEKNDFINTIVHDLKNPIYNISLLAKTIRSERNLSQEDIEEFATDIELSSSKVLSLVTSILELASFENTKEIHLEPINLNEVVMIATTLQKESARQKNITLILNQDVDSIDFITDRDAFVHIFDNILSNAIKYTPSDKKVIINYFISQDNNNIIIEVIDQGPGISEDDQKKMFGKFAKLSAKPTGGESSSGLGLYAVKLYAEMINAQILVESKLGEGSKFIILLPYLPPQ